MNKYHKSIKIVFYIPMTLFLTSLIGLKFVDERIKFYLLISILIAVAMLPICMCVGEIVISVHKLNNCSAKCFSKINKLVKGIKSSGLEFQEAVMYINQTYTFGEVKELMEQKSIYDFYERKDFLLKNISFYDDITQVFSSLIISVLSSLLVTAIEPDMKKFSLFIYFVVALLFVFVIFYKYPKRGQNGMYFYFLYEYELNLLEKAIRNIEESLKVETDNVAFIETRHNVLNALYCKSIKAKKKTKIKIENDIAIIKRIKLEVDEDTETILKEYQMVINRRNINYLTGKISVAYIVDENGIECFASDDFKTLYEIVTKHDLCVDVR